MTKKEKAREVLEEWVAKIDGRKLFLDLFVQSGVPFEHPDTGKWHDRSGLGFNSYDDLVLCGDLFIFPNGQPEFKLR